MLAGRDFTDRDTLQAPRVAIVNEAFVRVLLDSAEPLGRTFWPEVRPGEPKQLIQVIGIVRDSAYSELRAEMNPTVFLPISQQERISEHNSILLRSKLALPA